MFRKLISSLPFNPSLIGQVSFYAKRLHKENSMRRLGLLLIVLVIAVQMLAIFAPSQPTLAQSRNDILPGGFNSKEQAVNNCNRNDHKFATILAYFNISCHDIQKSDVDNIKSTAHNRDLYSMGRLPYDKPHEVKIKIDKAGDFYMRPLWSWDTGSFSTYKALVGKSSDGKTFMLLFDCGNLVLIGKPKPKPEPCPLDSKIDADDPKCKSCPYNKNILKTDKDCKPKPCPLDSKINADDPKCKSCPYNKNILKTDAACKPCDESLDRGDKLACLVLSKSARNITTGITDANNTMAKADDVIEYTLSVENTGDAAVKNFVVEENISDILDYADVVDLFGGSLNDDNIVSWPAIDIGKKQTVQKFLSVKVKNPVPQTPISSTNQGTFDLTMTNVYGNAINVLLPGSVVKTTEQISGSLPNTGPGEILVVSFILTSFVAYFVARARLMSKEVDIITSEFSLTGGI